MAPPRVNTYWVAKVGEIYEQAAQEKDRSATAISLQLKHHFAFELKDREREKAEYHAPPSPRSISRIIKEHQQKPEAQRIQHRLFSWPQSMGTPDLPWEASRAMLELLGLLSQSGHNRPLNRNAKWYWRISQALPAAPPIVRYHLAAEMAFMEVAGVLAHRQFTEPVEKYLVTRGSPTAAIDWTKEFSAYGSLVIESDDPIQEDLFAERPQPNPEETKADTKKGENNEQATQ
ncbi:MAG: hypothetical protein EXR50_03370 [Dehalococcoidia bacterium]|nr:hypothetical protein [Dehalococcoidia bacterium]